MKTTIAWGSQELINQYQYLSSGHFFDKDTMRFFSCRMTDNYERINDREAYFITTEKAPYASARRATIRKAKLVSYTRESDGRVCERIEISSVTQFNSLTLIQAKRQLLSLIKT